MLIKSLLNCLGLVFFYFSYPCTEDRVCDEGLRVLNLLRGNFDNKNSRCLTSRDKLEELSSQLLSFEDHLLSNSSLKYWYACYLCSQKEAIYGKDCVVDVNSETLNNDLITRNYIKGLSLFGQLHFSSTARNKERLKEYQIGFLGLAELKINNKVIGEDYVKLQEILYKLEEEGQYMEDSELVGLTETGAKYAMAIYNALKVLKNEDIVDTFLYFTFQNAGNSFCNNVLFLLMRELVSERESFSDYMKYLYSHSLDNKTVPKDKKSKTRYSEACKKYILDRINSDTAFKNKYIEALFYSKAAEVLKSFDRYEEAIPYYERALSYYFEVELALRLSKLYLNIGTDYKRGIELFKQAKERVHSKDESKRIHRFTPSYLDLLEQAGQTEEYEKELLEYTAKIIENRSKNIRKWGEAIKQYQVLNAVEKSTSSEQILNQSQRPAAKKVRSIEVNENSIPNFGTESLRNSKSEYPKNVSEKKKTHGIADPSYNIKITEDLVEVAEETPKIIENLRGTPLEIFRKLFSCYDNPPISDDHLNIYRDAIGTLMDALGFPFKDGKGSHKKGLVHNNSKKYMIVLPKDRENGIGAPYIKFLREKFLDIGLYPKDLEESLRSKGKIS